ncbi:hypothetical protein [Methanococcoides alaskense]|uniref:Uncharacterized protein n=1 Tax=Methanococcoides alaskense TaxID=325778 RepID=A0AA90U0I8_9EURY|nr:hypothetical protein [Methanococcoides alaskense]MDR6223412.1 hypothetical protein [Methanococcoides alaskense]
MELPELDKYTTEILGYYGTLTTHVNQKWHQAKHALTLNEWFNTLPDAEKYAFATGSFNVYMLNSSKPVSIFTKIIKRIIPPKPSKRGWELWMNDGHAKPTCESLADFLEMLPKNESTEVIKTFVDNVCDMFREHQYDPKTDMDKIRNIVDPDNTFNNKYEKIRFEFHETCEEFFKTQY